MKRFIIITKLCYDLINFRLQFKFNSIQFQLTLPKWFISYLLIRKGKQLRKPYLKAIKKISF